ncbi:MAG: PIG-L family deacetylase [Dehalococcoidia bacterium]|nr:PIG-L family deacetylase [Dehalococcoidia bacterium]
MARRLLAFIPHPDDEAYSFAGTLALAARRGAVVRIVAASSGEGGERHDGGAPGPDALADTRERELAESCRVLGADEPVCWRLPDGGLATVADGPARVAREMAAFEPDAVLALGADGAYGHPDHLAVYRWVLTAWERLPEPRPALLFAAFPRGLFLPQYEQCIGMMGDPPNPPASAIGVTRWDEEVDIRAVAATKLAAIAAHRTQLPGGDPRAIFPPGIVDALLEREWFTHAGGAGASALFESLR